MIKKVIKFIDLDYTKRKTYLISIKWYLFHKILIWEKTIEHNLPIGGAKVML